MAGDMKLTYFNARGKPEITRMLFKLAGKEFVDNRVTREEWEKLKPSTPKGQLPILEVDGKMMCESIAIARFVARETNLYGANNWEAAEIDMVLDSLNDVIQPLIKSRFQAKSEEEKAEALKEVEKGYQSIEKLVVGLKKGKFLHGDKPSVADSGIHMIVEGLRAAIPTINIDTYTAITEISKNFAEIPAIAEWIKSRPVTEF